MTANGSRWISGILGAFISGGASSVGGVIGAAWADPQHFNLTTGVGHLLHVVGAAFLITGIVSLAKFLKTHPIPGQWDGAERRNNEQTGDQDGATGKS